MARMLQLKWSDEAVWKTVGEVVPGRADEEALTEARSLQRATDRRYPQHTFTAEFRILDDAQKA